MSYKLLHILIEGYTDKIFFEKIIKPMFETKYKSVILWEYSQKKGKKVDRFIKSIKTIGSDYIYCIDINNAPCVTAKRKEIQNKFENIDEGRITVVIKEIESWYVAGLDMTCSGKLGIHHFSNADDITKEKFNSLIPKRFVGSKIDFMVEILKYFSIEIAKEKNRSFGYFLKKYSCK